jgi:hypothetical protein
MLASQLRHHPAWTAGQLADGLAYARDRLAPMRAENLPVAAAFSLSYADLTQTSSGCSAASAWSPGRTSTPTPPPPSTAPPWTRPAAASASCTSGTW